MFWLSNTIMLPPLKMPSVEMTLGFLSAHQFKIVNPQRFHHTVKNILTKFSVYLLALLISDCRTSFERSAF